MIALGRKEMMTRKITKPKNRKSAPKAALPKGTPQNKTEIELLIARYKWLEADQTYQASTESRLGKCTSIIKSIGIGSSIAVQ